MGTELNYAQEMERKLQKDRRFHEKLVSPFTKAVSRYELLSPGDRVCVCISGGKDSMLMAKLFQILKKHQKFDFDVKYLVMDPGYSAQNRAPPGSASLSVSVRAESLTRWTTSRRIPAICARACGGDISTGGHRRWGATRSRSDIILMM